MEAIDGMDGLTKPKKHNKRESQVLFIDAKQLKLFSETYAMPKKIIRRLIISGAVSPGLNTSTDHAVIKGICKLYRDREFCRQLLCKFPYKVRYDLCKPARLSSAEKFVYKMYDNKPKGEYLSTKRICEMVCKLEGKTFQKNKDSYSKEVYAMVVRIRYMVYNRKKAKNGVFPIESHD